MDFWLYKQAQQNGHHIAITDGQESYTYQNLYCEASLLAKRLKAYQQSRVGLYIDNSIQSIILIHACWLANIEIAMINTRLTPNEMTNQMRSIDVQLIFAPCHWNCEGFKLYRWMILNSLERILQRTVCWTIQWVSNMIHRMKLWCRKIRRPTY